MSTISKYITDLTKQSSCKMAPFIIAGKLNIEFVKGNQNIYIDKNRYKIQDKPLPSNVYLERKVFNRMLPIYLTRFGTLSGNMPIPGFKPQNCLAKAQNDAVKGNSFIKDFMNDCGFKNIYKKLITHADMFGVAWVKTGVDWSAGDSISDIEANVVNEDGKTNKTVFTLKEGRPFIDVIPIHEIFPDNIYAESMDDINELVHRRVFSVSYIERKWGIKVSPEKMDSMSIAGTNAQREFGFYKNDRSNYAYVYEYYQKPNAVYPDGRYVLLIKDKVLYDGPLPYQNADNKRKIPFDFVTLQGIPGFMVGVTVYSQIIPIQETYNSVKNRYLEYINHIAIGQLYVYENSLVNPKSFTTKPGKIVMVKRNSRLPQPVQKDKVSVDFISFTKSLEDDMLVAAGLSQLTAFGTSKSNVRTDGVVDKIDESDQNKLVNAVDNLSNIIVEVFKKVIYCEQFRIKEIENALKAKPKDDYAVKNRLEFVNPEMITIVNRSFLMQNDQTVDKKLQQASGLGLYNPQAGLSFLSKLNLVDALNCSYIQDTLDPSEKATHELIEDEHYKIIEEDTIPEVFDFHLHEQHLFEHNIFRISPEVRMLEKTNEKKYKQILEQLDIHIKEHQKLIQSKTKQSSYDNAKALFKNRTPN